MRVLNHINGVSQPAVSGEVLPLISPRTGAQRGEVARSGPDDANLAVQAAVQAQSHWANTPVYRRAELLRALADHVQEHLQQFALAECEDTGKPLSLALQIDIPRAISNLRFFASAIEQDSVGAHHMPDAINYTVRKPLGTVVLITPWNLPLYLLSWKLAPALACGNTVVAKPSEFTPSTATMLAEAATQVGFPPGVFNVVHGYGAQCGSALVSHPNVAGISFTGGTATGSVVGALAGQHFKKVSLELGGKNPTIVFADADLKEAIPGVCRAAFTNQGQVCLCGSRIFVHEAIAEPFIEGLVAELASWQPADPLKSSTKLGALIHHDHVKKVLSYIQLAKDEGGTVLSGGQQLDLGGELSGGCFVAPTLIEGLSACSRTSTEEIFGPVATIHRFSSEEEVLTEANGVRYGLAANIWTQDLKTAHRVAQRLDTGMVWVNTWLKRDLRVPFGGVKHSGVGREGGRFSLDFYSHQQNICIQL